MKLNCDLGESFGNWTIGSDAAVMPYIDQANIACGFHAGDPIVLAKTISLAKHYNVDIGAHPSYPDLVGFGRRSVQMSATELIQTLHYQLSAFCGMAAIQGMQANYVKPHGALYNDMMKDTSIRQTIFKAIATFHQPLMVLVQATPQWESIEKEAQAMGLVINFEAFADRRYNDDGSLVSRQHERALLNENEMLEQVRQMATENKVTTIAGTQLSLPIHSLCVHGDNPTAIGHIQQIRQVVNQNDV